MPSRDKLPKHFCPAPFTQLFLYPTGDVFPCCENGYKLGNVSEETIESIWNGRAVQALREEFLSGKIKTCTEQIKFKRCHLAHEDLLGVTIPAVIQAGPVRAFDLILNGRCNLECVMCRIWTLPNQVYDRSTFWEEGEKGLFAQLEKVSVKSGEPFIQKDVYRLIEKVSSANPRCRWTFTTNGQYRLTPKILEYLDRVDIDCINVSIDSLDDEVYPRIRIRGDLARTLATLDAFVEYRKRRADRGRPFRLAVNMAVQKGNCMEPPRMARFCAEKCLEVNFLYVSHPPEQSLSTATQQQRLEALEEYYRFLDDAPAYVTKLNPIVRPLLEGVPEARGQELTLRWKRLILAAAFHREYGGSRV